MHRTGALKPLGADTLSPAKRPLLATCAGALHIWALPFCLRMPLSGSTLGMWMEEEDRGLGSSPKSATSWLSNLRQVISPLQVSFSYPVKRDDVLLLTWRLGIQQS